SGGMKKLADERTDCATSLNDRTFRAEGATRADRDRCGNGLKDRDSWLNAAPVHQHCFHGLRNAVSLDLWLSIFGHEADDDSADHRDQDYPQTQLGVACADKVCAKPMVESDICKQDDQLVQT